MRTDDPRSPLQVNRLNPQQATAAGSVIAASHADYPAFRHVFPNTEARRRALVPFMVATVRDAAAHGHALIAESDGVIGVALWMPPGTFPLSSARKVRMAPALIRMTVIVRGAMRRFAQVGSALERAHPPEASWYLQAMGVHPRAQRQGAGSRLMAAGIALADKDQLPCYLQTSDPANVNYYERFGFRVVQPAIETYQGGPTYIGMTRPAKS
ncbi:MAG TPA: GNAT family N-acetyltransferase [Jiangellaceae bacterium]|nr:GNAT family N-acetyltransferase [Jiangellaceae bacterium]